MLNKVLLEAMAFTLGRLQELQLPVELTKCGVVASSAVVTRGVSEAPALKGVSGHQTLRNLGTNAVAGTQRKDGIAIARQNVAETRAKTLRILRQAGADIKSIHKAGPIPAALWGTSVAGLPLSRLDRLREASAKPWGKLAVGASAGLRLGWLDVKGVWDPACLYSYRTVFRWGLAIWNGAVSLELSQVVLEGAAGKMGADEALNANIEAGEFGAEMFEASGQ